MLVSRGLLRQSVKPMTVRLLAGVSVVAVAVALSPAPASAFECYSGANPVGTDAENDGGSASNTACGVAADANGGTTFDTSGRQHGHRDGRIRARPSAPMHRPLARALLRLVLPQER